jgi:hypothetical protein
MEARRLIEKYHNFFEKRAIHSRKLGARLGWRSLQVLTGVVCYPLLSAISGIATIIHQCTRPTTKMTISRERITKKPKKIKTLPPFDKASFEKEVKKAKEKGLIKRTPPKSQELMDDFREVAKLRKEKEETPALRSNEAHQLARKVAKAKFAYRLGIKPVSPSTGVHRTYYMLSTTGKELGVFKETKLHVTKIRKVWRKCAACFGIGHELVLNQGKYAQVAGERAAYLIKKEMGLDQFYLPPVKLTHFTNESGKKTSHGAFLVFCKDAILAEKAANALRKKTFSPQEIQALHSAFLYDALLGNLDRRADNWMVRVTGENIEEVALIDNSNILPREEPSVFNITASMARFVWRELPVAGYKIPKEVKQLFLRLLDNPDAFVDKLFHLINEDKEVKKLLTKEPLPAPLKSFSEDSQAAMKKRVHIIKKWLQKPEVTLADIGYAL